MLYLCEYGSTFDDTEEIFVAFSAKVRAFAISVTEIMRGKA